MLKQKQDPTTNSDPIEAKVDAMMAVSEPAAATAKTDAPLDIFAGQPAPLETPPSAPLLPKAAAKAEAAVPMPPAPDEVKPQISTPSTDDDISVKPLDIDSPQTDAAIADIVAQEADEVLAAQDAGIEAAADSAEDSSAEPARRGHPVFWFIIFVLVILIAVAAVFVLSPGLSPSFAP